MLKILRPGIFKEMLIKKDDITVTELMVFLQTHLTETNKHRAIPRDDVHKTE